MSTLLMSGYLNPYSSSTRWLRGNLHAHTCCGRFMDLGVSGRMYASLGYDFLAVTDHNRTHDADQIQAWASAAGLVVVPGEENGRTDHIIELGVHEVTPTGSDVYAARAQALKEAGGFVFGCHPQEYAHGSQNVSSAASVLHAVEIYNGLREARGTHEGLNVQLWDELLTRGDRLWAVATDDFHCAYITPGHGWVGVQVPEDTQAVSWQLIVEQLKRGAFYASTYPPFESIELSDGMLTVQSSRTQCIRVIGPGGRVLHESAGDRLLWDVVEGLAYFRIEAVSGIKRAWSQPFYAA